MSSFSTQGTLVTLDLWLYEWPEWVDIREAALSSLEVSKMHVVDDVEHHFDPQGTTAVWILAESHMAIHTYPEESFMAIDIFTCGDEGDPVAAAGVFATHFNCKNIAVNTVKRGVLPPNNVDAINGRQY